MKQLTQYQKNKRAIKQAIRRQEQKLYQGQGEMNINDQRYKINISEAEIDKLARKRKHNWTQTIREIAKEKGRITLPDAELKNWGNEPNVTSTDLRTLEHYNKEQRKIERLLQDTSPDIRDTIVKQHLYGVGRDVSRYTGTKLQEMINKLEKIKTSADIERYFSFDNASKLKKGLISSFKSSGLYKANDELCEAIIKKILDADWDTLKKAYEALPDSGSLDLLFSSDSEVIQNMMPNLLIALGFPVNKKQEDDIKKEENNLEKLKEQLNRATEEQKEELQKQIKKEEKIIENLKKKQDTTIIKDMTVGQIMDWLNNNDDSSTRGGKTVKYILNEVKKTEHETPDPDRFYPETNIKTMNDLIKRQIKKDLDNNNVEFIPGKGFEIIDKTKEKYLRNIIKKMKEDKKGK